VDPDSMTLWIRIRIRIRIELNFWIRIRIRVRIESIRIHNPAVYYTDVVLMIGILYYFYALCLTMPVAIYRCRYLFKVNQSRDFAALKTVF
jgi:hypothetical protein